MPSERTQRKRTKEEGEVYVSSCGTYYMSPEITAEKLTDFRDNVYGRGLLQKQKNLLFTEKFTLNVTDPDGEADADLQKTLLTMSEDKNVRLWANMQRAYADIFWYGIALFNPVWGYGDGAEYRLLKLRHLPATSFATAPMTTTKIYSQILQGIIYNEEKKEPEFWQTQELGNPARIENIFYIKDPATTGLAGESVVLPLVPIFEMLKFTWNTQMQQANRTGAKILFIRITDPQPASHRNGNVSDIDYANEILKNWSKNTAFQLRGNMELIDTGIKDDSNNLEIIDALHHLLIDYITPTSFISREGSLIGGSEKQREELLYRYVQGILIWLADQFEMLLLRYLEYNDYRDYTVQINIPAISIDRSEIKLKQAEYGFKTKSLTLNEIRERLEAEHLDEKDIEELLAYYDRVSPPKAADMMIMQSGGEDKRKRETPEKVTDAMVSEMDEVVESLSKKVIEALENE